jgi:hypothetical protein
VQTIVQGTGCGTRAAERRDLLLPRRGAGRHRGLAAALQHGPAALVAGLQATSTRDRDMAAFPRHGRDRLGADRGTQTDDALRVTLDHPMGAGHWQA